MPMDHAETPQAPHRDTRTLSWIAATAIGVIGAAAWWVPTYPPDPWASIVAWLVWIGAALVSAGIVYLLGARGKTVALASVLAVAVTFLAWPVIFFVLAVTGLVIELLTA